VAGLPDPSKTGRPADIRVSKVLRHRLAASLAELSGMSFAEARAVVAQCESPDEIEAYLQATYRTDPTGVTAVITACSGHEHAFVRVERGHPTAGYLGAPRPRSSAVQSRLSCGLGRPFVRVSCRPRMWVPVRAAMRHSAPSTCDNARTRDISRLQGCAAAPICANRIGTGAAFQP
jgi:hypothetical protein